MAFESILGNEPVKDMLRHTLSSGRIGHAYILEGGRGIGKTTIATAFAGEILKTATPQTHPDFTVVTNALYDPAKTQTNVLVDTIRNMKRDVYIRPYAGDRKVYLIPHADSMLAEAQNSLLKVFEEPPEYCTIILLAENANSFLATILSRAVLLRLHPLKQEQVVQYLMEQGVGQDTAQQVSAISGGSVGKALSLLEDTDAIKLRGETLKRMEMLLDGGAKELYELVRFFKQNKGEISFILEVLLSWSRDLLYAKLGGGKVALCNADRENEIRQFAARIPRNAAARFSEITINYQRLIEQNANYPIAVLCMATEYWEEIHDRNHRR